MCVMKRKRDPLHQARVAAVHLAPDELARVVRRKDEFGDITRELLDFIHEDPAFRSELEEASSFFFSD